MGAARLALEVKRPGRGVNHPPPPTAEAKQIVDLYLFFSFTGTVYLSSDYDSIRLSPFFALGYN